MGLVEPGSPEWSTALSLLRHDMYHKPEYVVLDARLYGGAPLAFVHSAGSEVFLLPLIVREIPGVPLRDAISPYGYPAPVCSTPDPLFWDEACRAMAGALSDDGIISLFVRMHPLLDACLPALTRHGALVRHGETVSMDLTISPEQMWSQTRSDHRNHVNRARRAGTKVVFDDWDRLGEWVGVYHDNMRRVGAGDYYFFTTEHLDALHTAIGDRMHLAVALEGDEVVGGNTFFEHDGIATGYVSSTRRARGRYADELLYDEVRRFCKARGDRVFHLGGGKGGSNDSLFTYKAGFSPSRHPFHTWRVVTAPAVYRDLVRQRHPGADPDDLTATFPPYR